MALPNRTDRRLHWRIELFKLCWASTTGAGLLLLTLARSLPKEGWTMTFATAALVVLAVFTVMMGALVTMSIRALRDE